MGPSLRGLLGSLLMSAVLSAVMVLNNIIYVEHLYFFNFHRDIRVLLKMPVYGYAASFTALVLAFPAYLSSGLGISYREAWSAFSGLFRAVGGLVAALLAAYFLAVDSFAVENDASALAIVLVALLLNVVGVLFISALLLLSPYFLAGRKEGLFKYVRREVPRTLLTLTGALALSLAVFAIVRGMAEVLGLDFYVAGPPRELTVAVRELSERILLRASDLAGFYAASIFFLQTHLRLVRGSMQPHDTKH